jgi:hypothetical protein
MHITVRSYRSWRLCPGIAMAATLFLVAPRSIALAQTAQPAAAHPADLPANLVQVRAALDKYRDPIAAVYDGYLSSVGCIEYPRGATEGSMQYVPGGMGVHFLNMQLVGSVLDPAKPQVLIYEPRGGSLHLVAAEWFMPVSAAGGKPPAIFGKELQGPMEGHAPLMPAGMHHYDLHVWLWKNNPAGTFSPTNPAVTCPKGDYSFAESAPKTVPHGQH